MYRYTSVAESNKYSVLMLLRKYFRSNVSHNAYIHMSVIVPRALKNQNSIFVA